MKTIVIPDIHLQHPLVDGIVAREAHDAVVCLGDYFDNWGDRPEHNAATAHWLIERLQEPGWTFLLGNHDTSYLTGMPEHRCSGWTPDKQRVIRSIVNENHLAKMKFSVMEQGWLLSHAGWSTYYLRQYPNPVERAEHALARTLRKELDQLVTEDYGITWLRWEAFRATSGWKQIFGHTPAFQHRRCGDNYNLDSNLREYGVIEDGVLTVKPSGKKRKT